MLTEADGAEAQRKALDKAGKPIPARLGSPEIMPGGEVWLYDFLELSTDRQTAFAVRPDGVVIDRPGPIPAASVARHTAGWAPAEAEAFRQVIRHLDVTYREIAASGFKAAPRVVGVLTPATLAGMKK